jgi:hypothetical protein
MEHMHTSKMNIQACTHTNNRSQQSCMDVHVHATESKRIKGQRDTHRVMSGRSQALSLADVQMPLSHCVNLFNHTCKLSARPWPLGLEVESEIEMGIEMGW